MADYFDERLALTPEGIPAPGAVALVYAEADTGFTAPLEITDMLGVPMANLVASPNGIYPQFMVTSGEQSVLAVSGSLVTKLRSVDGMRGAPGLPGDPGAPGLGLPDPADLPDGYVAVVTGHAWSAGPALTGGGGSGAAGVLVFVWNGTAYVDANGATPPTVKPAGYIVLRIFLTNGDPTAPFPTYPTWVGVEDHWALPGEA